MRCASWQRAGATSWPDAAIDELCAAFAAHDRMPRFELVDACWPGLVPALERRSFTVEQRFLGLACGPGELVPVPPPAGVELVSVERTSPDELIRAFREVSRRAFEELDDTAPVTSADIARFRSTGAEGVLARDAEGRPVGSAAWLRPAHGVTEIAGVGVVAAYRRRGIAGALTAAATRDAFAHGAELAFLTPGDDGAARVYARAGFAPSVHCVHISRPSG